MQRRWKTTGHRGRTATARLIMANPANAFWKQTVAPLTVPVGDIPAPKVLLAFLLPGDFILSLPNTKMRINFPKFVIFLKFPIPVLILVGGNLYQ